MRHELYENQQFGWDENWGTPSLIRKDVFIENEVADALASLAEQQGTSPNELIHTFIVQGVQKGCGHLPGNH